MLQELRQALSVQQKIQITVWDPERENVEYTFESFIKDIGGLMVLIAAPATQPDKIAPLLQKDRIVGAVLETYPLPLIFYPVILGPAEQTPEKGYWLKIPEDGTVEILQRRRHVRVPIVLPLEVNYRLGSPEKALSLSARTEDLSGGGLRFTAMRSFLKGQMLSLHLKLSPNLPAIDLKAEVVTSISNRIRKQPDDLYATACRFVDLEDAQEMLLVRECFRRELEMRR